MTWLRIAADFAGAAIGALAGRLIGEHLGIHLPAPASAGIILGVTVAGFMRRRRPQGR